jgi:hypothetical protein
MSEKISNNYIEFKEKAESNPNQTIKFSEFNQIAEFLGFEVDEKPITTNYKLKDGILSFSLMSNNGEITLKNLKKLAGPHLENAYNIYQEKLAKEKELPEGLELQDGWSFEKDGKNLRVFHKAAEHCSFRFFIGEKENDAINFSKKFNEFSELLEAHRINSQEEIKKHPIYDNEYFKKTILKNEFEEVVSIEFQHKIYPEISITIENKTKGGIFGSEDFKNLSEKINESENNIFAGWELIDKLKDSEFKEMQISSGADENGLSYARKIIEHKNFNRELVFEGYGTQFAIDSQTQLDLETILSEFERREDRHKKYNKLEKFNADLSESGSKKTLFLFDTNDLSYLLNTYLRRDQKHKASMVNYGEAVLDKLSQFNSCIIGTTETIMTEFSGSFFNLDGSRVIKSSDFSWHHHDFATKIFRDFVDECSLVEVNTNKILNDGNSRKVIFRTNDEDTPLNKLRFNYRDEGAIRSAFKKMRNGGYGEKSVFELVNSLDQKNIGAVIFVSSDNKAMSEFMELQSELKHLKLGTCNCFALVDALSQTKDHTTGNNKSIMYELGFRQGVGADDFLHAVKDANSYVSGFNPNALSGVPKNEGIDIYKMIKIMNGLNTSDKAAIAGYKSAYESVISLRGAVLDPNG